MEAQEKHVHAHRVSAVGGSRVLRVGLSNLHDWGAMRAHAHVVRVSAVNTGGMDAPVMGSHDMSSTLRLKKSSEIQQVEGRIG